MSTKLLSDKERFSDVNGSVIKSDGIGYVRGLVYTGIVADLGVNESTSKSIKSFTLQNETVNI